MDSRIPPRLDAYLRLPPETALVLLSGVLGTTTNWLIHRYLYSLLASSSIPRPVVDDAPNPSTSSSSPASVVFVSFLRDYAFWKDGVARLGLDLGHAAKKGCFVFVDGLSGLCSGAAHGPADAPTPTPRALTAATAQHLRKELSDAVAQVQATSPGSRTVLIVDQPDVLLAISGGGLSSQALRDALLDVRENVHSSVITCAADEPLVASQTTTLEKEHASFVLSLAHDAHLVMSLRKLDSGTARDVSGVVRITAGGEDTGAVDNRDLLYYVAADGGVRVFERGE
ncbi:hypothetical protein F4780DRAFT_354581 [Xylariomycetidae sp. FL0641]|nr:hypothetical protein F4780DRAFT_354581 [Xylariomycetidae sp. FL0641]